MAAARPRAGSAPELLGPWLPGPQPRSPLWLPPLISRGEQLAPPPGPEPARLKAHFADKRGPGVSSCEWACFLGGRPAVRTAPLRHCLRPAPSLQSRGASAERSGSDPHARIVSILRVRVRCLPATCRHVRCRAAQGAHVKLVFSVPGGVFCLDILFLAKKHEINRKDSAPPGAVGGPPEERSPAGSPSVPTFRGLPAAAGRPAQPAVCALLFLALVWSCNLTRFFKLITGLSKESAVTGPSGREGAGRRSYSLGDPVPPGKQGQPAAARAPLPPASRVSPLRQLCLSSWTLELESGGNTGWDMASGAPRASIHPGGALGWQTDLLRCAFVSTAREGELFPLIYWLKVTGSARKVNSQGSRGDLTGDFHLGPLGPSCGCVCAGWVYVWKGQGLCLSPVPAPHPGDSLRFYRLIKPAQEGDQVRSSAIRLPVQDRLVPLRHPSKSWRWGCRTGGRRSPLSMWPLREAGSCSGQVQG